MEGHAARVIARLLLPRALLVAIRFQALAALVLVHLQTAFLFQVAHGFKWRGVNVRVASDAVELEFGDGTTGFLRPV